VLLSRKDRHGPSMESNKKSSLVSPSRSRHEKDNVSIDDIMKSPIAVSNYTVCGGGGTSFDHMAQKGNLLLSSPIKEKPPSRRVQEELSLRYKKKPIVSQKEEEVIVVTTSEKATRLSRIIFEQV
jgi:hypothetical protein